MATTEAEVMQAQQQRKTEQEAIAPRQRAPLQFVPSNVDEAFRIAQLLSQAGIIPDTLKGKPHDLLVILLTGAELGISPMQAIREIYVVKGKPMVSSLLKVALVKQSPVCEFFRCVKTTEKEAIFETKRRGEGLTTLPFYIEQAKHLMGNDNWRNYPALMLRRRCASQLADEVYPEYTKGIACEADEFPEPSAWESEVKAPPPAPTIRSAGAQAQVEKEKRPDPAPEAKKAEPAKGAETVEVHRFEAPTNETAKAEAQPSGPPPGFEKVETEKAPSGEQAAPASDPDSFTEQLKTRMSAAVEANSLTQLTSLAKEIDGCPKDRHEEVVRHYTACKNALKEKAQKATAR